MCGGGGSKAAAPAPTQPGYMYGNADNSNRQQQVAAIETDKATRQGSYGSALTTSTPNNKVM